MSLLPAELAALAAHLAERRPAIMKAWREAIRRDPTLTSGDALPRAQLNDHIPSVLVAFECELGAPGVGQPNDVRDAALFQGGDDRWAVKHRS